MTGLQQDGLDMAQAIRGAFDASCVRPDEVQYINAHGSSTAQNDLHETNAFKAVWESQAYRIPISSIKSILGMQRGIDKKPVPLCMLK